MKTTIFILVLLLVVMLAAGCGNPIWSPDSSTALSNKAIHEEMVKLNSQVAEQNKLLERIANATEVQAGTRRY